MTAPLHDLSSLARYTAASQRAADQIITAYSTSFTVATRMLGARHRSHVRNVYALVRVADELVDGAAAEANFAPDQQRAALDRLETQTLDAVASGYCSNPIVHAFAHTARAAGITAELITPFFASMRMDLTESDTQLSYGTDAHADYVYGSAEVVGLMCLRIFVRGEQRTAEEHGILTHGARRLGAAFQNVNFLRDLADDTTRLGRSYLTEARRLDDATLQEWITTIRAQLADAERSLPLLPADARVAVDCARRLFAALTDKIAATNADALYRRRIRVTPAEKLRLAATARLRRGMPERAS